MARTVVGHGCTIWPVAPALPCDFTGDARVAWEARYGDMLAAYYRLCERVVPSDSIGSLYIAQSDIGDSRCKLLVHGACVSLSGCGGDLCLSSDCNAGVGEGIGNGGAGDAFVSAVDGVGVGREGNLFRCGYAEDSESTRIGEDLRLGRDLRCSEDETVLPAVERGSITVDCDKAGLQRDKEVNDIQNNASSVSVVRDKGKHWARNRAKRFKRKLQKRLGSDGGDVGDANSIVTVDTRTAVEIEAASTLAARRVVENKLAIARGEVQLRSFANKDKTEALEKLDAARMEQRINEAKAKSQASYKKCDESMKSLGSTGSAGEFALKQEIKKARDNKTLLDYVQAQADLYAKYATPEVNAMVAAMPAPELENEFDVFGDCPESYTEDQRESYFLGLARQQEENDMRTAIAC